MSVVDVFHVAISRREVQITRVADEEYETLVVDLYLIGSSLVGTLILSAEIEVCLLTELQNFALFNLVS